MLEELETLIREETAKWFGFEVADEAGDLAIAILNAGFVKAEFGVCCHKCAEGKDAPGMPGWPISAVTMIVCSTCGNKRCPHATDHALLCTGSNEPNQTGSIYQYEDEQ